jgi:RimJ/RimL family protein N-acetyltransferase
MTLADVPEVLAGQAPAAVICLADVFPQDAYPFPGEALERRWQQEIATPLVDCYVVLLNGSIVGFAATRGEEFLHFGIDVEHWGTGIAQSAHDAVLERMRARGVQRAWLRVFTKNGRGRRFYEKLGWHATGDATRSSYPPYAELLRYEATLREEIHGHNN